MSPKTVLGVAAATLIFDKQGRVLVLRRSIDDRHRPGEWDIPGGAIDIGEPVLDGAIREAREEVGVMIPPNSMQLCYAHSSVIYHTELKERVSITWLVYAARLPSEQSVQLSEEHDEYHWWTLDEFLEKSSHQPQLELVRYVQDNGIMTDLWS
jgi:8-oxo-dGTP pyrophosphatase MutT (NUDIX family)